VCGVKYGINISMAKALVFGATGQLGSALIDPLLDKGWKVTAVTRSRPEQLEHLKVRGVEIIVAENKSHSEIIDKPYDTVFEPTAYNSDDAKSLLKANSMFGSAVVVSSCSVYADAKGRSLDEAAIGGFPEFSKPMTEDTPTVSAGDETYSTRKVAMENVLRGSKQQITILRPCAIYGRYSTHPREWWLIKRALDGRKKIPIAYNAESIFHTSNAAGIASLTEICMSSPNQRILNVADPKPLTIREIASALEAASELKINLHPFAGTPVGSVGDTPWSTPLPYILDCSRAKTLGWDGGMEYIDAVTDLVTWLMTFKDNANWRSQFKSYANYSDDPFDYAAEDRFMADTK
jgi:nucleoside-diphosphate-sugar epimerase